MTELREFHFNPEDFLQIQHLIRERAGINLSDSKNNLVYSRLVRRLRVLGMRHFSDYLDFLHRDEPELEKFINALTTNHTAFFRESHHFEALAEHIKCHPGQPLKIWCAASSTGEEPYSIAIAVVEAYGTWTPPVKILATDIDSQVLEHAKRGVYALDRLSDMTIQRKKAFFQNGKGPHLGYARVKPELSALISFRRLNLLDEPWPMKGPFDIIFCRNVMIYFDKPTQMRLLGRMMQVLKTEGIYFAGHSEGFVHASEKVRLVGKSTYMPAMTGASNAAR